MFSGGGLISIVKLFDEKAVVLTRWPEEVSVDAMGLVALMLKRLHDSGNRVISHGKWVAYIPESSQYIVMAKYVEEKHVSSIVGFLRRLALAIRDLPEESTTIGKTVLKIYQDHFRKEFSEVIYC